MPEDANADDHIEVLTAKKSHEKGCVTKHEGGFKEGDRCSYRGNGYAEMKGSRKSLYHIDFTKDKHGERLPYLYNEFKLGSSGGKDLAANWRFADNPRATKNAWWFKGSNFKTAYLPYNHNYHHILPFTALQKLTYTELSVLQESGYNLNGKKNMIILPCLDAYGIAMMLPSHPYGHTVYNRATKTIINEIKQDVSRNTDGHKIKRSNVQNFKAKLESWQSRQFTVLVNYGKLLARREDPLDPPPNQVNGSPIAAALG